MSAATGTKRGAPPTDFRRGACPSIATPMRTGDGLLVRFRPETPGLSLSSLGRIAQLSAEFGNGIIEVTARGNIQIRGLTDETAAPFSGALQQAGIATRTGPSIETSPLAGMDPAVIADARALADHIAARIENHIPPLSLAPKLSIIVDGGGSANLSALTADIRLDAISASRWRVALAGDARTARPVAVSTAGGSVEAILLILEELDRIGPAARGRDLDAGTLNQKLGTAPHGIPAVSSRGKPSPLGTWLIGDETVLGIKLRYGRMGAEELADLLNGLGSLGVTEIRPAHGHALMLRGLDATTVDQARRFAEHSGFITQETDPANGLSVCTGAKGCASGTFDTRNLAGALLAATPGLFDGSLHLHVSGCAKGCAHPACADFTLSGRPQSVGLIKDGRADDTPLSDGLLHTVVPAFIKLDTLIRQVREKGETNRSALDRLAPSQLTAMLQQGMK